MKRKFDTPSLAPPGMINTPFPPPGLLSKKFILSLETEQAPEIILDIKKFLN